MAVDEWDRRELCPNETCVGVIGANGQCKVCGTVAPNWGDERRRGLTPLPPDSPKEAGADDAADADDEEDDADEYEDGEDGHDGDDGDDDGDDGDDDGDDGDDDGDDDVADPDPDWDRRKLCSDGACIGIVGPSGKCTTCGKSAS